MSKMNAVKLHESWLGKLENEFTAPYFVQLKSVLQEEKAAGKEVFPPSNLIFNALNSTPLHAVKVVIIGQDPYHNPGEAMGLSFSVPRGVRIPPSLANIYKELNTDLNIPPAKHGDLSSWANQGVLLLNTALTVVRNQPNSHSKIGWTNFTDAVLKVISEHNDCAVFMLWGRHAQAKAPLINAEKHLILSAAHPSPLAGGAFFGSKHFSKANAWLKAKGLSEIDWNLR